MEQTVFGQTTDRIDINNFNNSSKTGITEMIRKLSITAVVTGVAAVATLTGGSASASFGDPVPVFEEQVQEKANLASVYRNMTVSAGDDRDKPSTRVANADYTNFIVGPGDENEEGDQGTEEESGNIKVQAAPAPATLPNVSAGDDNDKPSSRVANADYTNFIVGPGDPNEETGAQSEQDRGDIKVQAAPSLASLYRNFTVGAGDDRDKPSVIRAQLPVIGPGDPCDVTGCEREQVRLPVALFAAGIPNVSAGDEADKPMIPQIAVEVSKAIVVGPGDPNEETGPRVQVQSGGSKNALSISLASLYQNMTVSAGDDNDKPTPVKTRLPVIGPGDENEESGPEVVELGGGIKLIPAPLPRTLPNVSAGDDADKPRSMVENADYTNFIVGPGDPRDEG